MSSRYDTYTNKGFTPPPLNDITIWALIPKWKWLTGGVQINEQNIKNDVVKGNNGLAPPITLLRTRPDGIVIFPVILFRLCPGCPGFDTGFILKTNQNLHLFIFSTISELFNVYWYQQKVLEAARWEDRAIIKLSECIWIIPRLFRHYHGMPWL